VQSNRPISFPRVFSQTSCRGLQRHDFICELIEYDASFRVLLERSTHQFGSVFADRNGLPPSRQHRANAADSYSGLPLVCLGSPGLDNFLRDFDPRGVCDIPQQVQLLLGRMSVLFLLFSRETSIEDSLAVVFRI